MKNKLIISLLMIPAITAYADENTPIAQTAQEEAERQAAIALANQILCASDISITKKSNSPKISIAQQVPVSQYVGTDLFDAFRRALEGKDIEMHVFSDKRVILVSRNILLEDFNRIMNEAMAVFS